MALLLLVLAARNVHFLVEQPLGSLMDKFRYIKTVAAVLPNWQTCSLCLP